MLGSPSPRVAWQQEAAHRKWRWAKGCRSQASVWPGPLSLRTPPCLQPSPFPQATIFLVSMECNCAEEYQHLKALSP